LIAPPPGGGARDARRYRGDSLILESRFETPTGAVTVIDVMPPAPAAPTWSASWSASAAWSEMRTELVIRFGYGARTPWVTRCPMVRCARRRAGSARAAHRT